ncbi:MAG: IclR family transcriptional regulator [Gemmatimonadota bacterium]|jgi:DNA-binding IclR family transcriptional regulator
MSKDRGTAVDKALDVLFHIHEASEAQAVSDVARALEMPKSTVHRLLTSLRRRALIEQDEVGRYQPGLGALRLAAGLLEREPVVVAAHAVLAEEARDFGETFFLVAARAGRLVVLEKAEGTGVLRVSPEIGSEVPARATAVGKLYLAHAPELLNPSEPTRYTDRTVVDEHELTEEVEAARRLGFALNDQEWIEGLVVVAAPVFSSGELVAAVCTAMSVARLSSVEVEEVARRAMDAAERIESRMRGLPA